MDSRAPLAGMVAMSSIIRHQSQPTALIPMFLEQSPLKRRGLTGFSFLRYLVPHFMGYKGIALFMDADQIVRADIHELFDLKDDTAVQVVKNKQRFEWPSVMLFDCAQCTKLTPEYVEIGKPQTFSWAETVGELPEEWNFLCGYDTPYTDKEPKLIHHTRGIPAWPECRNEDYAKEWQEERAAMNHVVSWLEFMGTSVHTNAVLKDLKKANGNDISYIQ